jgi:hypothetical protein
MEIEAGTLAVCRYPRSRDRPLVLDSHFSLLKECEQNAVAFEAECVGISLNEG